MIPVKKISDRRGGSAARTIGRAFVPDDSDGGLHAVNQRKQKSETKNRNEEGDFERNEKRK